MEDILQKATALADEAQKLPPVERRKVLDHLRRLSHGLEDTQDAAQRILYTYFELVSVRIGIDLGLFEILCESQKPVGLKDLADRTKCDPRLLARLLRYLASQDICLETGTDEFAGNNNSKAWTIPGYQGAVRIYVDIGLPGIAAMPGFLKDSGYKDPTDPTQTPVMFAQGSKDIPFFAWIQANPAVLKDFATFMGVQRYGLPTWMEAYPYAERAHGLVPEKAFFVDVGGGFGHQAIALRGALPDLPNKIIVEDLPDTVKNSAKHEGVDFVAQDFFTPQQIKGAKIYYMRNILHDWPDDQVVEILKHLKDAMDEDSVILIDEMYLPEKGVHWQATALDMQMMLYLSSVERTKSQWADVIDRAGLKIQKTYQYTKSLADTVIECVAA